MGSSWSRSWPPAVTDLDVTLVGRASTSEDELIRAAQDADALLVSTREAVTRRVLENIPRVKVISRYGVGLDNVDLDAAADAGIVVTHYPGYCTSEVADHALAMILALNRRIVEQDRALREGAWVEHGPATRRILRGPIQPLREQTLGIVGFGRIGQAVAARAKPFNLDDRGRRSLHRPGGDGCRRGGAGDAGGAAASLRYRHPARPADAGDARV